MIRGDGSGIEVSSFQKLCADLKGNRLSLLVRLITLTSFYTYECALFEPLNAFFANL